MYHILVQRLLHRAENTHKYDYGHVLILGGSAGMVGAPLLAGKAALRVGAGLVTIATDKETADKLDRRVEEIMTLSIPSEPEAALRELLGFIAEHNVTSLAIGPGLKENMAHIVKLLVGATQLPTVLDAGGLTAFRLHTSELEAVAKQNKNLVITPHTGEYTKLMSLEKDTSMVHLQEHAVESAKRYQLTIVLKGHHTFVAHPDGEVYKNMTGNPGLATAGTGDVLTGVIVGLLAQGIEPAQAAELGVLVHGLAGDLAAKAKTEAGMIASDVVEFLPEALKQLQHQSI